MNVDIHLFKTRRDTWKARIRFRGSDGEKKIYTAEWSTYHLCLEAVGATLVLENIR